MKHDRAKIVSLRRLPKQRLTFYGHMSLNLTRTAAILHLVVCMSPALQLCRKEPVEEGK